MQKVRSIIPILQTDLWAIIELNRCFAPVLSTELHLAVPYYDPRIPISWFSFVDTWMHRELAFKKKLSWSQSSVCVETAWCA